MLHVRYHSDHCNTLVSLCFTHNQNSSKIEGKKVSISEYRNKIHFELVANYFTAIKTKQITGVCWILHCIIAMLQTGNFLNNSISWWEPLIFQLTPQNKINPLVLYWWSWPEILEVLWPVSMWPTWLLTFREHNNNFFSWFLSSEATSLFQISTAQWPKPVSMWPLDSKPLVLEQVSSYHTTVTTF